MTLNEYIKGLQKLKKRNPKLGEYPVAYSRDDEGNGYQIIKNEPYPCQIHNILERDLEVVGYQGEENISDEDINCIIIN